MAVALILWNQETNTPVSKDGSLEYFCVDEKTGSIRPKWPWSIAGHINGMMVVEGVSEVKEPTKKETEDESGS